MGTAYVHVDANSVFACESPDGETLRIGGKPVKVPDSMVAYLDACGFVKRAGKTNAPDQEKEIV